MPVILVGLADLLPAAVALLLLGAFIVIVGILQSALDQLPGWGPLGTIRDGLKNAASNAISAATRFVSGIVRPIENLWVSFSTWADQMFTSAVNAAEAHAGWLRYVLYQALPSLAASLWRGIQNVYDSLYARITGVENYLLSALNGAISYLGRLISDVETFLQTEIQNAVSFLIGRITAVSEFLASQIAVGIAALQAALTNAVAYLLRTMIGLNIETAAQAQREARAAEQSAYNRATQWAAGNTANQILNFNQALEAAGALGIAGALPDIRALGKGLADVLPGELTGILPALGSLGAARATDIESAIAVLSTVAVTSLEGLEKCAFPQCDKLGKFGDEMASVMDGVILALMIAFVAAAVTEPEGTAKLVDDVMIEPLAAIGGDIIGFISGL